MMLPPWLVWSPTRAAGLWARAGEASGEGQEHARDSSLHRSLPQLIWTVAPLRTSVAVRSQIGIAAMRGEKDCCPPGIQVRARPQLRRLVGVEVERRWPGASTGARGPEVEGLSEDRRRERRRDAALEAAHEPAVGGVVVLAAHHEVVGARAVVPRAAQLVVADDEVADAVHGPVGAPASARHVQVRARDVDVVARHGDARQLRLQGRETGVQLLDLRLQGRDLRRDVRSRRTLRSRVALAGPGSPSGPGSPCGPAAPIVTSNR